METKRVFFRSSRRPQMPHSLSPNYLSMYLSIYLSIYISIYLSIYLPIYLSIYLSIKLFLHLSIHLPSFSPTFASQWSHHALFLSSVFLPHAFRSTMWNYLLYSMWALAVRRDTQDTKWNGKTACLNNTTTSKSNGRRLRTGWTMPSQMPEKPLKQHVNDSSWSSACEKLRSEETHNFASNSHVRGCGSNTCGQQRHTSSAWVATFVGVLCGLAVRRDTHVNCERYPSRNTTSSKASSSVLFGRKGHSIAENLTWSDPAISAQHG